MEFRLRKGLDIPLGGPPDQLIGSAPPVERVAFVAADFLSLRQLPGVLVSEGESVCLGQPLIRCKQHPQIVGVSPGSGVVEEIIRGDKRALKAIVVRLHGDDCQTFQRHDRASLDTLTSAQIKKHLQETGMWLALRTRPFSLTPEPESTPHALFITAMDTQPLAARPDIIINAAAEDFVYGLEIISKLCEGPTYVCSAADAKLPVACDKYAKRALFSGPHPAGLAGTHIHHISPVDGRRTVWTIHYQDVIAIGRLFATGRFPVERIVALCGPRMQQPRLVETRLGACVADLLAGQAHDPATRIITGSVLSGRHAIGWAGYLGWHHYQVTAVSESHQRELLGWLAPGLDKFSASRAFISHLRSKQTRYAMDSSYHGSPRAMVPIGAYERVMPLDLLITPLLRALLVGDIDTAIELGCLELDEEDLALCSFVCPSKHDFGVVLREILDRIQRESAS